jgi:hypothetical protein
MFIIILAKSAMIGQAVAQDVVPTIHDWSFRHIVREGRG